MSLLLSHVFMPLALLVAGPDSPTDNTLAAGDKVFYSNFDSTCDTNFDAWPDGWTRRRGPGYPSYVKIQIQPIATPAGAQCLKVELDGGGAAVFSPPIKASPSHSYMLEGLLRTDGLKHDRACFALVFLDADKRPLVTFESEKVVQSRGWKRLSLGPITPPSRLSQLVLVALQVEPGASEDLEGTVEFAEVALTSLPRLDLKTNQAYNLFLDPAKVEVTCTVSGFAHENSQVNFKLFDPLGACLANETLKCKPPQDNTCSGAKSSDTPAKTDSDDTNGQPRHGPPGIAGCASAVAWQAPISGPGFYRVRAELQAQGSLLQTGEISLAVIEPRMAQRGGQFGWSLPQGSHPIPLAQLNALLCQAGVNRVKYPLWVSAVSGETTLNALLDFGEQLNAEGIELVGMLIDPPEDMRDKFRLAGPLSAADIFSADPRIWYPSLAAVISQLAGQVRWWQLGSDNDASLLKSPELIEKIKVVKKELDKAAGDINLGIGWNCPSALPSQAAEKTFPLRFLALSSDRPLSADELSRYLTANKDCPQKRWVSLQPLARDACPISTRVEDLVMRMIAAKISGADAIFCPDPFDARRGLMNNDGTPAELFLPWRTTALELGAAKFLGSIQLAGHSKNLIFARANDAVMTVWNAKPTEEVLYLSGDAKQIDLWGRATSSEKRENGLAVRADRLPTFVTGLNAAVAGWQIDLRFARQRIPSIFAAPQENMLVVANTFGRRVLGSATIRAPRAWQVTPQQFVFSLDPGEQLRQPVSFALPDTAEVGPHEIHVDFQVQADQLYKFSALQHIEVGTGDAYIKIQTRLNAAKELEVEERLFNCTDRPASFRCELFTPDRRRQMHQVLNQGPGQNTYVYKLEDGRELLDKTLWLRAAEIDGPRILNYRFTPTDQGTLIPISNP
jgi:hypothetical protein